MRGRTVSPEAAAAASCGGSQPNQPLDLSASLSYAQGCRRSTPDALAGRTGVQTSVLPEIIRTANLILRPWSLGDVPDVFAYAADEEWGRYLPISYPYREEDAHLFVATQIALDRAEHTAWAMEYKERAVGGINLRVFEQGRIAEMDYAVARSSWGRGFASEAARAVVAAAFRGFPSLLRLRSMIDARNAASARVLEKVGLKREGLLRANRYERGQAVDEAWYGILRHEWDV